MASLTSHWPTDNARAMRHAICVDEADAETMTDSRLMVSVPQTHKVVRLSKFERHQKQPGLHVNASCCTVNGWSPTVGSGSSSDCMSVS